MKIAVNHPERYAAALIMSGSAIRPEQVEQGLSAVAQHSGPLPTILKRITKLQQEDFVRGTENDVNAVAAEKAKSGQPLTRFFITCGGRMRTGLHFSASTLSRQLEAMERGQLPAEECQQLSLFDAG